MGFIKQQTDCGATPRTIKNDLFSGQQEAHLSIHAMADIYSAWSCIQVEVIDIPSKIPSGKLT